MLLYLKDNKPLNLEKMLEVLKNYQISFLFPFIFHHKDENQVKDENFGQNNLSSSFLDNAFPLVLITFVMPWVLLMLLWGIKKLFRLEKITRIGKLVESIETFLKYNLIFLLFQNSTQEMSLFFALQLGYFSFSSEIQIVSNFLCLFFLIVNFLMIFWLVKVIKAIISDNCYEIPNEYKSLFQNIDITKKHALYYCVVCAIKKFFLSFFIVLLYSHSEILAICLIILSIAMYLFTRIIQPFEDQSRNIITEITEWLLCCIYCLLFLYKSSRLATTDPTALYIGYITILLVILIIILNFGLLILNLLHGVINFICSFNKLREAIQLGDKISQKISSIKMREFTYDKVYKDNKSGIWYKQSMFNKKLVNFWDKSTQYK